MGRHNLSVRRRTPPCHRILYGTLKAILLGLFTLFVIVPLIYKYTYTLQRSMIFLNFVNWPVDIDYNSPQKYGLPAARNFYVTTNDGVKLGVWHILPKSLEDSGQNASEDFFEESLGHGEPVILYMHGNSGSRATPHRLELYKVLKNLDCHVVAFDYRSYGDSSPIVPSEAGVVSDGKYMYHWLAERVGDSALLIVWGHSLGTGVSSHVLHKLADEGTQVKALILESPFNNLRDEIREHPFAKFFRRLPWFDTCFLDPVHANNLKFESDKHLSQVASPVLILHAEDDLVVPYVLGKRLFDTVQHSRPKDGGLISFVRFEGTHRYGHKYICRAPELPLIVQEFISNVTKSNIVSQ
ncbi:lysophosphatidylserine lipase ABHD12 isoform X2 [Anabrus simplex]|uniref:lysophosphatidylserine lipase ABHD12 isoform X2 n=1 Tax=Anabrus simplex TaxID=316456 RepID=UPI0035A2C3D7